MEKGRIKLINNGNALIRIKFILQLVINLKGYAGNVYAGHVYNYYVFGLHVDKVQFM